MEQTMMNDEKTMMNDETNYDKNDYSTLIKDAKRLTIKDYNVDRLDNYYSWIMPLVLPNMKTSYVYLRSKKNLQTLCFNHYGAKRHIQNCIGR